MKITAHIALEIDVDEASQDADHVARVVTGLAQSMAFRSVAEGVRVGDYSVVMTPIPRALVAAALERVAELVEKNL